MLPDPNPSEDELLTQLVRWHESAEQATEESRSERERERDYVDSKQYTDEEIAMLRRRKQPIVTINRIGPKIHSLLGMEQQRRTEPRAFPRTPADEDGAAAATDALRFVLDEQRWDRVRSECFDNFVVEGTCGVDVRVTEKRGEMRIEILPITWDRMWGDEHARARNWSDGKHKGQFVWMDMGDAIERWPDMEDALNGSLSHESAVASQTSADVPRMRWADPKRKRIRIAECWSRESGGRVFYTAFTKGGILERLESPYLDADGEADDGFVFGSCFTDRDGNRYGVVKPWMSVQDEINKRRSKAMHLINTRQTWGNALLGGDKNKIRQELAKPDGHLEIEGAGKFGEDFGVLPTNDMAAGQMQLLAEAKSEIDAVGVNAALAGKDNRVQSGRALIQRSENGSLELTPVFGAFTQFQHDVYRKVWSRIRQFWTAEKWLRVTDDDKNVRFVGLNQPLTLGEQLLEEMKKQRGATITPEELQQAEQQAKMDPAMQQVVGVRNNVGAMDVDIVIDDAPSSAAMQSEQFEALVQLAPQAASVPPPLFKALIEASSLRNKDKVLKALEPQPEAGLPPQVQQQMQAMQEQLQQAMQALQAAQAAANDKQGDHAVKMRELDLKEAELMLKRDEAQARLAQADPAFSEMKAGLERQAMELMHERQRLDDARKLLDAQRRIAELEIKDAERGLNQAADQMQEVGQALAEVVAQPAEMIEVVG